MMEPVLTLAPLNLDCFAINHGGRTVAMVSPQGYIDWMLVSPADDGVLLREVYCEPHLGYVLGLKLLLHLPHLCEVMTEIRPEILDGGARLRLTGRARDPAGAWEGQHEALLAVNPETNRFEWTVQTRLVCTASLPVERKWIEFNNVYPSGTGRCMLFAPHKRFSFTLMVDRDGVPWHFPHQHAMHYQRKIAALNFAPGTMAGFFGEELNPVVIVDGATLEPDWAICDMYYDLHCGARVAAPVAPGTVHEWQYRVKYLDRQESEPYVRAARIVPIVADDYRNHHYPRLALGRNDLKRPVVIDDVEDASSFRTEPPVKVWDRQVGAHEIGALRITNDRPIETVWSASPPTQIPAASRFQLTGLVKTKGVAGKGMFLRVRYHRFLWRPTPHVEWLPAIESEPVTGTTDWHRILTPVLDVPADALDGLVWIDVVLDGQGVGWLTDVGVDLQGVYEDVPVAPTRTPVPRR